MTHHAPVVMRDDLDDGALAAAAPIDARDPRQNAVAVHRLAHLTRGEVEITAPGVGNDKPVAVAVTADAPVEHVHVAGQAEGAAPVFHDQTVPFHAGETALERPERCAAAHVDRLRELRERQRLALP